MEIQLGNNRWEGYVDWRNRPAIKGRHGGMLAASFVLVVEVLENLAYLANASNLVLYLSEYMHLSIPESANNVTNFMGTAFLLSLLGGFLSDAYCTAYYMYLISAIVEFLGLILLTVQARTPSLRPEPCCPTTSFCPRVHGGQAALLFVGLYMVALGVGGIKGSLPTHGAEQFDESTPQGRKGRSTFFNYFIFALSAGALIAVTLVVWIEDSFGWQWGLVVSTGAILLSITVFLAGSSFYRNKVTRGSPLTTIFKVLIAAALNTKRPNTNGERTEANPSYQIQTSSSLRFLNRAALNTPIHPSIQCTVQEVEDVKIVMKTLPIFCCSIMLKCCLAQLSTFSVQQAATMDTKLGSVKVPPASLAVFPVVFIMILSPVYNHIIVPYARKVTKTEMGITHLQRIGIGLGLSIMAMAIASLVEMKRHSVALNSGQLDSAKPLPITFLWIAFQYLFLGSADLFTLGGLLEFFFTEAPASMRSLATSLSFAALAMGYFLSSVIVSIVNSVTGGPKHQPWLSGSSLNQYRLWNFYWLMCILTGINFLHYLFWAKWYKYRSVSSSK